MTNGMLALCNLSGRALPAQALRILALEAGATAFAGQVADGSERPAAYVHSTAERITLVLGRPNAAGGLSAASHHDQQAFVGAVQDLLDRHGPDLPARLGGEWAVLDWRPGQFRLVQSRARRDWLFFTRCGDLVAVCSDLERLAGLDWVGRELDPLGFAGALGRGALRSALGRQTILPGVERLEPGEYLHIGADREVRSRTDLPAIEPWCGTFADAIAASDELLDLILRERLAAGDGGAIMLSGGLDSATLAALLARAAGGGTALFAVTSVAPTGSGLPDESAEAAAVAERLGLTHILVVPGADGSLYRPHPEAYRLAGGPSLSPRHYLYRALAAAARGHGAQSLFDGAFGEMTLTSYMPLVTWRYRLRQGLKQLAGRGIADQHYPYHARLAPHRTAALAREVGELLASRPAPRIERCPGERWGYVDGIDKMFAMPTLADFGLRTDFPFRDPRLLQLFAGFPADYLVREGLNRAPARALMAGHLPEAIRLRRSHGAFSPDYMVRIQRDAGAALARIPAFRQVDAGDWIDLDWLEIALKRMAANGPVSITEAYEVQMTAMTAEFLAWWRGAG